MTVRALRRTRPWSSDGIPYLTVEAVVDAAFAAIEADRPRAVLRLRGGRALFAALSTAALVLPRRWEMLAIERFSRRYRTG